MVLVVLDAALDQLGLLLLKGLDAAVEILELGRSRNVLVGVSLLVQGHQVVVGVHRVVLEILETGGELGLLVLGQGLGALDLVLLGADGVVFLRAALETGMLVQGGKDAIEDHAVGPGQAHLGLGDLVVGEDDRALRDEAVGVQHAREGLGQNGLAGAGLTDDGKGFVLINVQRDVADGGQNSAADVKLDDNVLQ